MTETVTEPDADPPHASNEPGGEDKKEPVKPTAVADEEEKKEVVSEPNAMDSRSFAIVSLRHPGAWRTNAEMLNLLSKSESFAIAFKKDEKGMAKTGDIRLVFDSVSAARDAYTAARKLKLDKQNVTLEAHSHFFDAVACTSRQFFPIPTNEKDKQCTIYALHLLSTNREVFDGIFGCDVEFVSFLPLGEGKFQAQIRMPSSELAVTTRDDVNGLNLNDDEGGPVLRVCTVSEYEEFVKEEKKPRAFVPTPLPDTPPATDSMSNNSVFENNGRIHTAESASGSQQEHVVPSREVEEDEIVDSIIKHVQDNRINWAELTEKENIYEICDTVSAKFGVLPDSALKPAMLSVMQRFLTESTSHWMKDHLHKLIAVWKAEVGREEVFERCTKVQAKAPSYVPPQITRKRRRGNATRAARLAMGVGAMLQSARHKLTTEVGDVEIDEDGDGNFMLGGQELSFESWANFTRTSEPDVMVAKKEKKMQQAGTATGDGQHNFAALKENQRNWKKDNRAKRRKEDASEGEKQNGAAAATVAVPAAPPKPVKELDEGEIDSDEERNESQTKIEMKQGKGNKKHSRRSSDSTESSSSDSDDERTRKRDRKKNKSVLAMNPMFHQLYSLRHQVISSLSVDQKTTFAQMLQQIKAEAGTKAREVQMTNAAAQMTYILSGGRK